MGNLTLSLIFVAASQTFGLPEGLLSSLCFIESTHDVNAIHHDDGGSDSLGICQIKLSTAQWLGFEGDEDELMLPENNIYYAAKFLAHQSRRYNGDITRAVIAYNIGSARGLTRTAYSDKVLYTWGQQRHEREGFSSKRFNQPFGIRHSHYSQYADRN